MGKARGTWLTPKRGDIPAKLAHSSAAIPPEAGLLPG